MDLLPYWSLHERPFEATWDTRFFYRSRDHQEACSRLGFLAAERSMNMGMLTGEIGCGKTLTHAVFVRELDPHQFVVVALEHPGFGFKDLLGRMLVELETDVPGSARTKFARYERLRQILEQLGQKGRHLILIFDEAQEITAGTLNELKLLTNLNGHGRSLLTIILIGQPELRDRVARLPAIDQRISLRFHLRNLARGDAPAYLKHRLQIAGHSTGEIFTEEAAGVAFERSGGIPRELNRLAKLALELAWLREMPAVTPPVIEAVARDLHRQQTLRAA